MATAVREPQEASTQVNRAAICRRFADQARAEPLGFLPRALGLRYSSGQARVIEAIRDYSRVVVPSGNAMGKTYAVASIATWFLSCHMPAKVIITSAGAKNISRQIWPKFKYIREHAAAAWVRSTGRWMDSPGNEQWVWDETGEHGVFCISPDHPEAAGGYHGQEGTLFIIDEASGLSPRFKEAIDGCLASQNGRVLMIGNPIHAQGPFADAIREAEKNHNAGLWYSICLDATQSPNVTGLEPAIAGLATPEWIEDMAREYGRDSAFWAARVLGRLPKEDEYQLIHIGWISEATTREKPPTDVLRRFPVRAGVDVSRSEAGDLTVVQAVQGPLVLPAEAWPEKDLMVNTDKILSALTRLGVTDPRNVKIDDIGIGGGVTDRMRQKGHPVQAVNFGAAAGDPQRFTNQRAEAHWALRVFIKDYAVMDSIADGDEHTQRLHSDLLAQRLDSGQRQDNRIKLEPKDKIKAVLGRSPDYSDALAMAVYTPPHVEIEEWDAHDEYYPEPIVPGLD